MELVLKTQYGDHGVIFHRTNNFSMANPFPASATFFHTTTDLIIHFVFCCKSY